MADAAAVTCPVCERHADSTFRVEGMDCREEVELLERRLARVPGVEAMSVDLFGQRLRVSYDAARLSPASISDAVAETGMRAWLDQAFDVGPARGRGVLRRSARWRRPAMVFVSGLALAVGFMAQLAGLAPVVFLPAFGVAMVTGGVYTARRAWSSARLYSLDINVLMLLAVIGAVAIGHWEEGATVLFLFALAQLLESGSMARARQAIRALMDMSPAEAIVVRDGAETTVPVDDVALREVLVVRPGTRVPLDGEVLAGESAVDQAPITGESVPVDKSPGDPVFAGTINGPGVLEVRVTHRRPDTTLARIVGLVENAQATRAPSQMLVDRFARYYTPGVVAVAAALAFVPPLLGEPALPWVYRALVLLVVSCPCALVISTPVSIVSALAAAARRGVLVKGGVHLERLAHVRCVAFDKTGTLTRGRPEVAEIVPVATRTPTDLLRMAAAIGSRSEHPLAQAIRHRAVEAGVAFDAGADIRALPGLGAEGLLGGERILLGSARLFDARGIELAELRDDLDRLASQGRTAVLIAVEGRLAGAFGLADQTRDEASAVVAALRRQGVGRIVMLTGDRRAAADAVAARLHVDEVQSDLMPEDKVQAIERLRATEGSVAMVGDGVNDAPALAVADVGIAMGVAGTDIALETADVALMADELDRIPFALQLGRATVRNIRANVALSLGLKAVFLAMTLAGTATLWMAVLADMGASLFVIANGLRLLRR